MAYIRCPYCNCRIFTPFTAADRPNCDQILPQTVFQAPLTSSSASSSLIVQPSEKGKKMPPGNEEAEPEIIIIRPPDGGAVKVKKKRTWHWPGLRPVIIKGVVLSVQTQQETPNSGSSPNLIEGFFKFALDVVWPMKDAAYQPRREDKLVVITQIRVQGVDGKQRDARLEGRLIGANIALGDEITLKGRYRKGTLLVQRTYNHTSDARIMTRHASSFNNYWFF